MLIVVDEGDNINPLRWQICIFASMCLLLYKIVMLYNTTMYNAPQQAAQTLPIKYVIQKEFLCNKTEQLIPETDPPEDVVPMSPWDFTGCVRSSTAELRLETGVMRPVRSCRN